MPTGECLYDYQCAYDKKCLNRFCVDKCTGISCPYGSSCQGGQCVVLNPCANIYCIPGSRCVQGSCIPTYPTCFKDNDCQPTETCVSNRCSDRCQYIQCSGGYMCEYGKCIPICSKIVCNAGTTCVDGRCIAVPNYCRRDQDCRSGESCVNGICVNTCARVSCPSGSYCVNGECKLNLDVCPVDAEYTATACTNPRPTTWSCPVLTYIMAPTPRFCGVTSEGYRSDFVRACEACMNPNVDYYFDAPCHDVPFVCGKNERCLDYYCSSTGCRANEECPYDWQICVGGQCVDRCSILKCRDCKCGKCAYVEPYGSCRGDNDCSDNNWSCFGWKCVDRCQNKKCKANHSCSKGECKPNKGY